MKEKKRWQESKLNLPFLIPLGSAPPTLGNAWCCKNCDLIFLYTGDDNANGKDRCLCKFRCLSKLFQLPAQIEEDTVSGDVVKFEGYQPSQYESTDYCGANCLPSNVTVSVARLTTYIIYGFSEIHRQYIS